MNMAKRSKLMKEYYNSPQHVVSKRVSAPLSKNLKEQYKTNRNDSERTRSSYEVFWLHLTKINLQFYKK